MYTHYQLPSLPYSYDVLEPYIDAETMEIHHTKHHQGYVDKLNKALEGLNVSNYDLAALCLNMREYPISVRNYAGGHYNHSLFWRILSPQPQKTPTGPLSEALLQNFGGLQAFIRQFNQEANECFGSGWAWLVADTQGSLCITTNANQDNPLMRVRVKRGVPILGIDLWEHAYYLKYQNRRATYLEAIWHVIDWGVVGQNYEAVRK